MRKNSANKKAAKERLNNENERVLHRIKQRGSKRKYHAKKKTLDELTNEVSFSTPQKQVIKNKMRKLQWKYQENSTISSSSIVTLESSNPNTNTQQAIEVASSVWVSSSLWGCLSPSTKQKVKSKLQNEQLPIRMNTQIRKELGINLSINVKENKNSPTVLQKSIKDFFLRDDVTRACPETKKVKKTQIIQMKKCLFTIAYHHYAHCIRSLLQRVCMIVVICTSVNIVHIMQRSQAQMTGGLVSVEPASIQKSNWKLWPKF